MAGLTARQQAFVNEYLVDLNATQAAIRAGYSPKAANRQASWLLSNIDIQRALMQARAERTRRVQVDQDWVLARLVENVERAMQHSPVYDKDGNETGEYVYQGNVANGALKLLGQHLAMFTEKRELTGKDGHDLFGRIGSPEVRELARRLADAD